MHQKQIKNLDKTIGHNIRCYRTLEGLASQDMAKELGISQQQLSKYEKGINRISVTRFFHISEILNVDIKTLSTISEKETMHTNCLQLMKDYRKLNYNNKRIVRDLASSLGVK